MMSAAEEKALRDRVAELEQRLTALVENPPHFVLLGQDRAVRRDQVASVHWDQRHYMNGPGPAYLVVTMVTGATYRLEHRPHGLPPVDCNAIEKELLDGRP